MNNKITVNLDKEREIKFNLGSLVDLEEILGVPVAEIGNNVTMKTVLALLYVGLKTTDKDITMDTVRDIVTMDKLAEANEKVMAALVGLK